MFKCWRLTCQPPDDIQFGMNLLFLLFVIKPLQPGIKLLHNSMGSQHLDYNRLPLKYNTMIKVRDITMKYNQDNE